MSQYFQRPENALKRANELINIGNKKEALTLLHSILTAKRHRTWQKIHEQIMFKYMDVCVELKLSREAKDGLHQYRNISQQQAPNSLETVINYLVTSAEERARSARDQADQKNANDDLKCDDLEQAQTPESIMLSCMTDDGDAERNDRQMVVPWLKFLWETYRCVLEILRNNSKLELVYHDTCKKAFKFCSEYKRNTEFRRLCDLLRGHLASLQKHSAAVEAGTNTKQLKGWEGWTPESIEHHLLTRFAQLETATDMEMWTEGFRTVEEIHQIMAMTTKPPKPQLMATYYDKLAQIFWVSENYLCHAHAWYKSFGLYLKHNKNMTVDQKQEKASSVLLSALSIPVVSENALANEAMYDYDRVDKDKNQHLATLLGFSVAVRRNPLIAEIISKGILTKCYPELKQLYALLESDCNPLSMVSEVKTILTFIAGNDELKQYVIPLEKLLVLRLLKQLSSIYQSVRIPHFEKLLDGLTLDFGDVEKLLVQAAAARELSIRIDHQNLCLVFDEEVLETESTRNQLTELARRLHGVVKQIKAGDREAADAKYAEDKAKLFAMVSSNLADDHRKTLERKGIIEKRKEQVEKKEQERLRKEEKLKQEREAVRRAEEQKRLDEAAKKRERERIQRLKDEESLRQTKQMIKSYGGDTADLTMENLESFDQAKLIRETREQRRKQAEDDKKRQRDQAKRLDHITRAIREEERPVLKKAYEKRVAEARKMHSEQQRKERDFRRKEHENGIEQKKRLAKMLEPKTGFEQKRGEKRQAQFEKEQAVAKVKREMERLRAKLNRARKAKRAEEEAKAAAEEEAARAEEEAARAEERRQKEEAEAKAATARALEAAAKRESAGGNWDDEGDRDDRDGRDERDDHRGDGDRDRRGERDDRGFGGRGDDRDDRGGRDERDFGMRRGGGGRDERDDRGGGDRWGRGGGRDDRDDRFRRDDRDDRGGGGRWERGGGGGRDDRDDRFRRDDRDDRGGGGRWERGGGGGRDMPPRRDDRDDRGGGGRWERGGGGGGRDMPPRRDDRDDRFRRDDRDGGGGGRWERGGGRDMPPRRDDRRDDRGGGGRSGSWR